MGVCNCSTFCCTLLYVHSSIAIILMGKRELIALLNLSSWCLMMVERLFLAVPRGCLQFVIVVFPDHTHLLFLNVLECHFCVWSMDHITAWNEWIMLSDAEISVFAWFYGFLTPRYHPPVPVRENCPIWLWRNGRTIDSDDWFWHLSVTIFKQFVGTSF